MSSFLIRLADGAIRRRGLVIAIWTASRSRS